MTEGFASVAPPLALVAIGLTLSSGVRGGLGTRMHLGCRYAQDEYDENMKVYWFVPANDAIMRSTLNGSDLEPEPKTENCQLQFRILPRAAAGDRSSM